LTSDFLRRLRDKDAKAALESLRQSSASRDFISYGLGNILSGTMSFLLVPIYTRVLEKAQYGSFELVSVSVSLIGSFLTFGLNQLIGIRYFQASEDERNQTIFDLISMYWVLATPISIGLLLLSSPIASGLFQQEVTARVIVVGILAAYFSFFDAVGFSLLQQEKRARLYAALSIVKAAVVMGSSIVLVVGFRLGVLGVLSGILLGKVTGSLVLAANWTFNYSKGVTLSLRRSPTLIINTLRVSLPLMMSAFLVWAMVAADRYIIQGFLDTSSLGTYSVAARFAQIFEVLLVVIVARVYSPRILAMFKRDGRFAAEHYNRRMMRAYLAIASVLGLAMLVGIWLVFPWLIGGEYQDSLPYIPLLIAGKIMLGARNFSAYYLLFTDATAQIMAGYLAGLAAVIGFDFILVSRMGLQGAALGTLLAFSIIFFVTEILKRKKLNVDQANAAGGFD
jgi:O-antigen/teichoic acid export membrane protein